MPRYVFIAAVLTTFATPALAAEFYIARDPTTQKCKIVETKPDGKTMVMVGTEPYATKEAAKSAKQASAECGKS